MGEGAGEGREERLWNWGGNVESGVDVNKGSGWKNSFLIRLLSNDVESKTGGEVEGCTMAEEDSDVIATLDGNDNNPAFGSSAGDLLSIFILRGPHLLMLKNFTSLSFGIF